MDGPGKEHEGRRVPFFPEDRERKKKKWGIRADGPTPRKRTKHGPGQREGLFFGMKRKGVRGL